jgi:hypothetical protein
MSIQAPQGILNIPNAILRVGKLSVDEVVGADTILNTVARNTILLVDDEAYHENKNWALKLPNAWAGEFECNTASAGNYSEFNFYNEGASSNVQGYNLTFNDTAVELRYDGTLLKTGTLASTITGTGVKKVRLMFERTILSVTVDGTLIFTHDDTIGPRPRVYSTTAGGFLNFFTNGGALKNLKIVNEKWISDGTSNIAYVGGGEVAVGQALAFNRVSNVSQIKVDSNVVTEYTGPHDRPLRKYPEVAMTADAETASGYKGYKVTTNGNFSGRSGWEAFDSNPLGSSWATEEATYSHSGDGEDANTAGQTAGTFAAGGINYTGHWIKLELPKSIKLQRAFINAYNNDTAGIDDRRPKKGVFLGSNNDSTWDLVHTFDGDLGWGNITSNQDGATINFSNISTKYKYILLLVEEKQLPSSSSATRIEIFNIEYYGHEEGSGSLDTTLKTVYNVPATTGTQLEVYYDAKDLAEMPSIVTDLAGGDQNGTVTGHSPTLDETNGIESFKFDGVDDYITTTLTNPNTDWVHSVSMWVYPIDVSVDSVNGYMFAIGAEVSNQVSALRFSPDGFQYTRWAGGGARNFNGPVTSGRWHHVTLVSPGSTDVQVYLDGRLLGYTSDSLAALTLPQNTSLSVGRFAASASYSRPFEGSIANFRLYSKALNAGQVQELYDYQKDYFLGSKSQVTLYKGHLGVGVTEPSGQLELAGDERIQEYPPRALTGYETLVEGHGVFYASASSLWSTNGSYDADHVFDNKSGTYWVSQGNGSELSYDADGIATSDDQFNPGGGVSPVNGSWIKLKLPYGIKLGHCELTPRPSTQTAPPPRQPRSGIIWGSNDDVNWDQVSTFLFSTIADLYTFTINSSKSYKYITLQVTATQTITVTASTDYNAVAIIGLRFFGTPVPRPSIRVR